MSNGENNEVLEVALRIMGEWYELQRKEVRRYHLYSEKLAGEWPIYLNCDRWASEINSEMRSAFRNGELTPALERFMKLNIVPYQHEYEPGFVAMASTINGLDRKVYELLRNRELWTAYGIISMSTRPFVNLIRYPFETRLYVDSKGMRGTLHYNSDEIIKYGDDIPVIHYVKTSELESKRVTLNKIQGKTFYRGYKLAPSDDGWNPIHDFVTPVNPGLSKIVLEETYGSPEKEYTKESE